MNDAGFIGSFLGYARPRMYHEVFRGPAPAPRLKPRKFLTSNKNVPVKAALVAPPISHAESNARELRVVSSVAAGSLSSSQRLPFGLASC